MPVLRAETDTTRETAEGCTFCEEVTGAQTISLPLVKEFFTGSGRSTRILLETDNFFVVPSLGALVPGHILFLPKAHYYSVGEIPPEKLPEFEHLVQHARAIVSETYGPCSEFEHGCIQGAGRAGACIDHAHLHLLPIASDLRKFIGTRFGPGTSVHSFSDLGQFVRRRVPYLYCRTPDGNANAYDALLVPSQFFRQVVSATEKQSGNWDWKQDLRSDVVGQTYDALRPKFVEIEAEFYAQGYWL